MDNIEIQDKIMILLLAIIVICYVITSTIKSERIERLQIDLTTKQEQIKCLLSAEIGKKAQCASDK